MFDLSANFPTEIVFYFCKFDIASWYVGPIS
ncbi:hypothetical protein RRG08_064604 [Elysia crispata]|uniref:Uncharacterized protein n=1 Tax=Elysia crispata TaxID=231223 RepID=A0AAE1B9F6_9GAST|nr:hypothetical protein RRG08_064604 [Elysia crispata]